MEGYTRAGRFFDPILRPEPSGGDAVSWGEMVEARLVAEFRERNVPVQRLRPAITELRKEFGKYPLAHARPFLDVEGRELVRLIQDELALDPQMQLLVIRNGQLVLSETTQRFRAVVEYDGDVVGRLRPDARTPDVVMDPLHTFGQPAIRNVRTSSLAEDFRAGCSSQELAELYELTPDLIDEAIRFELIAGPQHAAA
jgi:uncharacterized protein (DUF433 family)